MTEEVWSALNGQIFGVWFLIGAALVFWMQAGFAMVEAGFTRAKNAGNIIMKNLMDFCIGTVVFILIGFSLLLGEDLLGLIGKPGFDIFTSYAAFDWSNFVFNLVFCATTATIVSGAMAERTKFLSYCIYSAVISALIYPIEAHWIWGGGWLAQMGFHDFAGSCAIHMVGGISALIGAKILGPRMGKPSAGRSGRIHPMAGVVRLQWRCGHLSGAVGFHLRHYHDCPGGGDRHLHDLHLGQVWEAGRLYVPERLPGRAGSHHRSV